MNNISVSILLCTYNGGRYLQEQLNSILSQTYTNWKIYASDDGSTDNTLKILLGFRNLYPEKLYIFEKSEYEKGVCRNFLSLAENTSIRSDYYAFCDQDDIWLPNKLERAIFYLENNTTLDLPKAYFGRAIIIDNNKNKLGYTRLCKKPPSFQNALVENLAQGNTTLFNHKTKLLFEASKNAQPYMHDLWLYLLITSCSGYIYYDAEPCLYYRQHDSNVIGEKKGIQLFLKRIKRFLNNEIRINNDKNISALVLASKSIDFHKNLNFLSLFIKIRKQNFLKRIYLYFKIGLYRQTIIGNISLIIIILLNKI